MLCGVIWFTVACSSASPSSDATPLVTPRSTPATSTAMRPSTTAEPPVTTVVDSTVTVPPTATSTPRRPASRVVFFGDSVAYDESPAIRAALEASGLAVEIRAFPGDGLVPAARDGINRYEAAIAESNADVVLYQISLWDLGDRTSLGLTYRAFANAVIRSGATLVFITPPPLSPPQQQNDNLDWLEGLADTLASDLRGQVFAVHSTQTWGTKFVIDVDGDGSPERKPDGVHMCPDGAARQAKWLTDALAALLAFEPADESLWEAGPWRADARYSSPEGICAPLQ